MTVPGWRRLLDDNGVVLLDGGLATELERRRLDLGDALWSARALVESPDAIRAVHTEALEAGADVVTAATYQASFPGFAAAGIDTAQAEAFFHLAVDLAEEACELFAGQREVGPFVAASIGPYGAYLADGSEYRGDYGISRDRLRDFHQARWELLAGRCSLLACETIPSLAEASVLVDLLAETDGVEAWLSFSCVDGVHIADGTPIRDCAALCSRAERVVAVGVNCTAPSHVSSLVREVREGAPELSIVAYPNSGEEWDAAGRCWRGERDPADFAEAALGWHATGARWIGGCCRTGPEHVRALKRAFAGA